MFLSGLFMVSGQPAVMEYAWLLRFFIVQAVRE